MRAALLVGLSAMILPACSNPPKADESESTLAMEDSARAHNARMRDAIQNGDSAVYMAAYPDDVVMAFNGQMFNDRTRYAAAVGQAVKRKMLNTSFSDEQIRVVGPRAAAVTLKFSMSIDSAGKPVSEQGVWSGVLGMQDGRTVILQQHLSNTAEPGN